MRITVGMLMFKRRDISDGAMGPSHRIKSRIAERFNLRIRLAEALLFIDKVVKYQSFNFYQDTFYH